MRASFGVLVRAVPALVGRTARRPATRSRASPSSASTSSTCRRSTRSGTPTARARNNALSAAPGDPGSPWAIGDETGGHDAVHPELGTLDDLTSLTAAAHQLGIDIALDFAIQCSADHPWLTEHPEWFHRRPDGTLEVRRESAQALSGHLQRQLGDPRLAQPLGGAARTSSCSGSTAGSRCSASTTPTPSRSPFWEWLIEEVHAVDRDVIFLAEAFTRRVGDATSGQDRLHPVLHLLHVEELPLGADRVRLGARLLGRAGVLPAELLRQHPGHPPRVPPARRSTGVRGAARPRRDAEPELRDLLRL